MTKKRDKLYITTPIYYANAASHLGSAYTTIAADILARWHRMLGKDVFFLTGTDEHGQKIQQTAEEAGIKPKEFVDKMAANFKSTFKLLNISNDFFIRTTDQRHEKEVQKVLQELYDKKDIYKGVYESYYCVGCEQYLTKSDLVDGCCPIHKKEPELRKEEAYLFKLSKYKKLLLDLYKENPEFILPENKKKEIISFVENGLQDISISRLKEKVYWGIELPFDKKHTCFVWVDAFWNYLTGLKINDKFDKFWPADIQLMAKDILRVHATIWPALLLATGNKLPKTMFVHGYFTINGQKMSKSLGNVISPSYLANKYSVDSLRYFLMRNISFGEDGDFDEKALISRHNNELADKLGNLVSRVSTLAEKYGIEKKEQAKELDSKNILKAVNENFDNFKFDKALNEIFAYIDKCNTYIQETSPWITKDKKVLYQLSNAIKDAAILLSPFMPETCEKIAKVFNFKIDLKEFSKPLKISKIKKADVLFKKIETTHIPQTTIQPLQTHQKSVNNLKSNNDKEIEGIANMTDLVKYNDFAKIDLRVGTIKKVEDIEGADKLYGLEVEIGKEKRTIVAGIKQHYKKEELKDKQIIVVVNLEPRKMKGIESKGMLLAAVSEDHSKVILISPEKKTDSGLKVQ